MGSGCSVAKEVSDIILINDDFDATLRAVMWGRNIYHNIGRFLQFQITVNISALCTVLIGSLWLVESPLSAVQLLWINLIMDTFAAFAFSTEPPIKSCITGPPFKADTNILTPAIWRQIFGVSAWNVLIMTILIILGPSFAGLDYKWSETANDNENKREHMTLVFNTFVLMQLFNQINCRKTGKDDFNVFEQIQQSKFFLLVVLATFVIQYLLI